jgi:hypothetical protein
LNPDWKENLEAAMAAAAEDEADVAAGGVGPGVAGEAKEGMAFSDPL